MSGGSFKYLYLKGSDEIVEGSNLLLIQDMASELEELGYFDAAEETRLVYSVATVAIKGIEEIKNRLETVWKVVERYVSGDSGLDHVEHVILKYREKKNKFKIQTHQLVLMDDVKVAIDAEPELDDTPPDEMIEELKKALKYNDIEYLMTVMRVIVRLTKENILERIESLDRERNRQ